MDQRFDAQDRRFDALQADNNRRFETVNVRFDTVLETIPSFDRHASHSEGQIEIIREQIKAVDAP